MFNAVTSIKLLSTSSLIFDSFADGIQANESKINELVDNSMMLVTALNTKIGYYKSAEIANKAHTEGTTLKAAALALGYLTEEEYDAWVVPSDMIGS